MGPGNAAKYFTNKTTDNNHTDSKVLMHRLHRPLITEERRLNEEDHARARSGQENEISGRPKQSEISSEDSKMIEIKAVIENGQTIS